MRWRAPRVGGRWRRRGERGREGGREDGVKVERKRDKKK